MSYEFSPIATDDVSIRKIAHLLRITFPKAEKYSDEFIDWQYRKNPNGMIKGYNAFLNGELVGHYAMLPIISNLFGTQEKGLLSLNTATHPDHQGKKLFTTLAEMSYKNAAAENFKFVVGVANANSTHGFITKLGFQLVGKLEAKLGIGKITTLKNEYTLDFENYWTKDALVWRLKNPEATYKIRNKKIIAATDQTGIEAILLHVDLPDNTINIGFKPIKLWIGINQNISWRHSFYFDIPLRLRPSPLNLIFKDLTNQNRTLDFKKVQFNAFDFDAY